MQNVTIVCGDYSLSKDFIDKFTFVYLDPPYKNTKQYSKQNINYEEFYNFCRELSKDNIVVISEYDMPDDFVCIWKKERKVLQKSDRVTGDKATEKLFTYKTN